MVYSKVDTIAKSQTDIESRVRVLEAQEQPDPRPDGGDRRRIGAVAGGVVAVVMKLLGGFRMSLAGLLNQEVQIKARTGTTYTGDPEYADLVTYPARISYKPRRVLTATGVERSSYARVTVAVEAGTRTSSSSPMAWSESRSRSPESTTAPGSSTIPVSTYEQTKGELSSQW